MPRASPRAARPAPRRFHDVFLAPPSLDIGAVRVRPARCTVNRALGRRQRTSSLPPPDARMRGELPVQRPVSAPRPPAARRASCRRAARGRRNLAPAPPPRAGRLAFTRPTKFQKRTISERLEVSHDNLPAYPASSRLCRPPSPLRVVPMSSECHRPRPSSRGERVAEDPRPVDLGVIRARAVPHAACLSAPTAPHARARRAPARRTLWRAPRPRRKLSYIDRALVGHIYERLLDQLSVTWSDLAEATLSSTTSSSQPGTAQIAPLSEPTWPLDRGAGWTRVLDDELLIPYRSIEPVAATLVSTRTPGAGEEAGTASAAPSARVRASSCAPRSRRPSYPPTTSSASSPATSCASAARPRAA
jgi:hypothetical protein